MSAEIPDETDQTEVQFLFDLYHDIGARLCDHLGHDWESVSATDTTTVPNQVRFDRCARCNETRHSPDQFDSSSSCSEGYSVLDTGRSEVSDE